MYSPNKDPHLKKLEQDAINKRNREAEEARKRTMEDTLFDIEVRRDKRERRSLVISGIALGLSIAALVLSLLQWILN